MKASSSTQILLLWLGASNFCHRILLTADAFLSTGGPISLSRRHLYQSSSTSARFVLQDKLTSEEIHSRLEAQLAKLREKDRASKPISIDSLNIVHEDEYIIVVDKPSGTLTVPSEDGIPSLAQTVFDKCSSDGSLGLARWDQMVVHRLGMDTSGLVVFAKTIEAVRGMNALFRTRKISRQYEALLAGHITKDHGLINLPIMRDYEHPPYMRISTEEHQAALVDLDPNIVGKKLLEAPKECLTHYQVISRDKLNDDDELPVTRVMLTSISGRTHQLNVHCAAFGHPIVGDKVYGLGGEAAPNGGLDDDALANTAPDCASADLQQRISAASAGMNVCVHAKTVKFLHPVLKEDCEFNSPAPF